MPVSTPLTSNGLPVAASPARRGVLREAPDRSQWRRQYLADGYLVLRNFVDPAHVLTMREAYLSLFDSALCQDGDARAGLFSGTIPEALPMHGVSGHPAHSFVRSEAFAAFANQPIFAELASELLNAEVKRVPRTPMRHFIRGSHRASRAHADSSYIDETAETCVTMWVPLGDCPKEAGALIYLEGSHDAPGLENSLREAAPTDRATDKRPISHDLGWVAERANRRWLMTDFKAGDIVVHVPAIIHASLDPAIDLMRVSTDIRFLRHDVPLDPRWQGHWAADDGY